MDIVERLRWSGQDAMTKHLSLGMAKLHAEAVEEIERLRARERMLRGMAANDGNPDQNVARRALALMDNTTELFRRIDEQSAEVPWMTDAICHACGLKDYHCTNPDCPNKASPV